MAESTSIGKVKSVRTILISQPKPERSPYYQLENKYGLKHLNLLIVGSSFPVEKEAHLYGFVTMLVNILLGLVLTPINLAVAFAPAFIVEIAAWLGLGAIIIFYFFRQLKGLFIAGRFLGRHKFHFFMYLCASEIAPLLIIGKLALGEFGFQ